MTADIGASVRAASRSAFRAGVIECLTLIPSYVPFGLVCGVAGVQAGLGEWGAVALAAFAFAGDSSKSSPQKN